MTKRVSILVPCDLEFRDAVGGLVRQVCERLEEHGEPSGFANQVISAFNEAFNNLATHGGQGLKTRDVLVNIDISDTQLIIEFQDDGESFEFKSYKIPDLTKLRESGMGLSIMRAFMDNLKYSSGDGNLANVLRLERNLTGVGHK
ncbi:MAG: ATP-binding protein [Deltaproteobacteria bacterium]|nr:ATP-binding protein [Deltaproteobacteria bacterium]